MNGAIPPLPQYAFMAWCSVKKTQGHLYNSSLIRVVLVGISILLLTWNLPRFEFQFFIKFPILSLRSIVRVQANENLTFSDIYINSCNVGK
jgi:hypothetical protein